MTRLMITSDLHLGHENIIKFRTGFDSAEHHHETLFENLASSIQKRDSLILLGDIAFSKYWLDKIKSIKCEKKLLICGNHDTEKGVKMRDLVRVYDDVMALHSRRNCWFSHCPIHPSQMRGKVCNIHGHLHDKKIKTDTMYDDPRYINACVEHTNFKPISFSDLIKG
ncbi:calcineurin-like phosphoesterase [Vibrio phage 1.182.O._10N.286.46.E1]|nr:calcineurin-like phosphoesterase [Vibrio phage 1.182.O._10N.286.46.E1]